jgi:hypothetical protein
MREQVIKGRYYVERSPKDGRDLATTIAERMRFRGLDAVAGPAAPSDVDYIVTYIDRWHWDMRMYMSDMRIELHTAKDRSLVGYGDSAQSSLAAMGKSYADVIDKALGQLLMPR